MVCAVTSLLLFLSLYLCRTQFKVNIVHSLTARYLLSCCVCVPLSVCLNECAFVHFEKFIVFHRIFIFVFHSLFAISTFYFMYFFFFQLYVVVDFVVVVTVKLSQHFRYALFYRVSVFSQRLHWLGCYDERYFILYHATIFPSMNTQLSTLVSFPIYLNACYCIAQKELVL